MIASAKAELDRDFERHAKVHLAQMACNPNSGIQPEMLPWLIPGRSARFNRQDMPRILAIKSSGELLPGSN